jgi:hypothetical protein
VKVTGDACLLAYRGLDEVFGLTGMVAFELKEKRIGKKTQNSPMALLSHSAYSRLAGYEDTNDGERLCVDPAIHLKADAVLYDKIERLSAFAVADAPILLWEVRCAARELW